MSALSEEARVGRGRNLTATVESHAPGPGEVMLLKAALVNELLGRDIASGEENGRGHGLCEQRAGSQSSIVPARKSEIGIMRPWRKMSEGHTSQGQ